MSGFTESENLRAISHMVMIADVVEVDTAAARAKVKFGEDATSAWLPWMTERASGISVWAPPTVGEQVVCLSPSGQTKDAVILGAIFSTANPPASNDGGTYRVKLGMSSLTMTGSALTLSSNGSTLVLDAGGITLNGARIDLN